MTKPGLISWLSSDGRRPAWLWPAIFFGALYLYFFRDLLLMRGGFVFGDYEAQFYPWSFVYWQALREGTLPLWTPLIQCGFPLFAEGQTGMLYAINYVLFNSLPFRLAYNAVFLAHFLMGCAFMVLFARRRGLSGMASGLAAICFTFGSVYAGSFYNIVSMRSLVWFPLVLYFADRLAADGSKKSAFAMALALGQSWLGGFPQTSVYLCGFTIFYFSWRLAEVSYPGRMKWGPAGWFAAAIAISLLIGAPQLWATQQLALSSTRSRMDPSFIFWGSAPPWNLATLFYYGAGAFLPARIFAGVVPLFLCFLCFKDATQRVWWGMAALAWFFALGAFNPVMWPLAGVPGFSMLRNPSKLLFFLVFALILLAARGFDRWVQMRDESSSGPGRLAKQVSIFLAAALAAIVACWAAARYAGGPLIRLGDWYTERFIIGKSHHRWSPEHYHEKVRHILESVRAEISFTNPALWAPFVFGALFVLLLRTRSRRAPMLCLALLSADLFVYGYLNYGSSFVGNVRAWPSTQLQESLPKDGRWLDLMPKGKEVLPANRNLLTGHSTAGAYSPLLDAEYFGLLGRLRVLDDAFGGQDPEIALAALHKPVLDRVGVRYLAVPTGAAIEGFDLMERRAGGFDVLLNRGAQEEYRLLRPGGSQGLADSSVIQPMLREWMAVELATRTDEDADLVWIQTFDPGWKVWVDGRRETLLRSLGAFQGVRVPAGEHRVRFEYRPVFIEIGGWLFALGWTAALTGLLITARGGRRPA